MRRVPFSEGRDRRRGVGIDDSVAVREVRRGAGMPDSPGVREPLRGVVGMPDSPAVRETRRGGVAMPGSPLREMRRGVEIEDSTPGREERRGVGREDSFPPVRETRRGVGIEDSFAPVRETRRGVGIEDSLAPGREVRRGVGIEDSFASETRRGVETAASPAVREVRRTPEMPLSLRVPGMREVFVGRAMRPRVATGEGILDMVNVVCKCAVKLSVAMEEWLERDSGDETPKEMEFRRLHFFAWHEGSRARTRSGSGRGDATR